MTVAFSDDSENFLQTIEIIATDFSFSLGHNECSMDHGPWTMDSTV